MILNENLTFYDILDLRPNATPQEIRESYLRTKATFNRDSVALYTIISTEEREATLRSIEEAYFVLSDPQRRRQYDQSYGFLSANDNPFSSAEDVRQTQAQMSSSQAQVIPIDRVLAMESAHNNPRESGRQLERKSVRESERESVKDGSTASSQDRVPVPPRPPIRPPDLHPPLSAFDSSFLQSIEMETEWRGSFLKKVREVNRISLEEMAGITKVTKTYLVALEEENFAKLPAPVYIRGFITQIAKVLKLPHDKVANAYLSRYHRNRR